MHRGAAPTADQANLAWQKRKWLLALWREQPFGGEHGAQAFELSQEVTNADSADLFGSKLQAAFAGVELRLREHDDALAGGDWWLDRTEDFRIGHDRDRHLHIRVAQRQIKLPSAGAGSVFGHLAVNPDGTEAANPFGNSARDSANCRRFLWSGLQCHLASFASSSLSRVGRTVIR